MVVLQDGLLWLNSLPECGWMSVDVAVFQRKKWQLWLYDSYHFNLNTNEQNFYRDDSWVLKSLPPCRTLSWGILSFGVRLAKAFCFLEEEQKADKYFQSWKQTLGFWKMHMTNATSAHCSWTSQIETGTRSKMVDGWVFQSLLVRRKEKCIVPPEFAETYYMFFFQLQIAFVTEAKPTKLLYLHWKFAGSFLVTWRGAGKTTFKKKILWQ